MPDCIFCKIIRKEISSQVVYEDDRVIAIRDINPQAPVHLLFIPREHLASLLDMQDPELGGHILSVIRDQATRLGIAEAGFRIVVNTGAEGGQTVDHLHFHVLAGRQMRWPPG